jgi:hypothetical protein
MQHCATSGMVRPDTPLNHPALAPRPVTPEHRTQVRCDWDNASAESPSKTGKAAVSNQKRSIAQGYTTRQRQEI